MSGSLSGRLSQEVNKLLLPKMRFHLVGGVGISKNLSVQPPRAVGDNMKCGVPMKVGRGATYRGDP